jgi:hypothetical protein
MAKRQGVPRCWQLQLLACTLAVAAGALPIPASADEVDAPPEADPLVQRHYRQISATMEAMLRRADALFSGERNFDLPTGSYLRVGARTTLYRPEDADNDYSGILSAKIRLPRTQDRLQVVLQQNIESVLQSPSERDAEATATGVQPDQNQYLGLRGVAVDKLKLQVHGDVGLKLRWPLDPYARLRVQRLFSLDGWKLAVSETLLWRESEKASATTKVGLFRDLGTQTVLSLVSSATWRQTTDGFDLSQVATLTHRINDRSLAVGEAGLLGQTQPNTHTTAYYASLRYRRKLYRDWLLFEVRPQMTWPRDQGYQPVPSLTLQIEAYFGENEVDKL